MTAAYWGREAVVAYLLSKNPEGASARVLAEDVTAGNEVWVGATPLYLAGACVRACVCADFVCRVSWGC